jgi:hypothetical protein
MSNTQFTEDEYKQFKRLVKLGESRRQLDRIESRFEFPKFIEQTGRAKCDAMFERLKKEEP